MLKIKNTVTEMKNALDVLINTLDTATNFLKKESLSLRI